MISAADLQSAVATLRSDAELAPQIVAWNSRPARHASFVPVPRGLAPPLHVLLRARGMDRLYSHQALAALEALAGRHIVVVTPTASGKTLCYELPVLQRLLESNRSALLLFPTKALAHDQYERAVADVTTLGLDPALVATYDGDTPGPQRARARAKARILISNPDMLHAGILPNHVQWRSFLEDLAYVVLDEIHTYRGVFGSQVSGVLWRLGRLCRFYGSDPRYVCTSATVANPAELARALVGGPVELIDQNGAPEPPLEMALYNPPIIDRRLGIRRSVSDDAQRLALHMLRHDLQTVCFTRSRLAVEQLVIALRDAAPRLGIRRDAVRGYRAGYLAGERREIEAGLRDGAVRCVVATSALELGIDVGALAACILVGYPGSSSSTWQRIGRVGRGASGGLAILVGSDNPLDQYMLAHPDQLFGATAEAARVNPHNLHVRVGQTRSALYELALQPHELEAQPAIAAILEGLALSGDARHSGHRWYWSSATYPAAQVSLRTADARRVEIISVGAGDAAVIGQVESSDAPRWVHPQAVYLHEGRQYLVRTLDLEGGTATVEPTELPFITVANERTEIAVEQVHREVELGELVTSFGEIRVTSKVTSFRREDLRTHQVLSREPLDMPEQVIYTDSCWLGVHGSLVARLEAQGLWYDPPGAARGPNWDRQRALVRARDEYRCRQCGAEELPGHAHDVHHLIPFHNFGWVEGENDAYLLANRLDNLITLCPACHRRAERQVAVQGTLTDLGHVMRHLVPLWVLCDPGDIGTHAVPGGQRQEEPRVYVYDRAPGGSGISEALMPLVVPMLEAAGDRVRSCDCEAGCPACIGPSLTVEPERKTRVCALVEGLTRPTGA